MENKIITLAKTRYSTYELLGKEAMGIEEQ